MDFKNLNGVRKLKRLCITCIELILNFCLGESYFQLGFFFNFRFQMHKTHLKDLFLKLCLSEIILRPFISFMAKYEVYNVFSF